MSSVGYHPPDGELPRALLDRATLFVETREAFEPPPVGLRRAPRPHRSARARRSRAAARATDEITVYKAMGHVMEDIVAAELVYAAAVERGRGLKVKLG